MNKHSRIAGAFVLLFGLMSLFSSLDKPRVQALHGSDILGLMASGACLAVALVGLLGRLRIPNE
jgi:hypothetical protein